jgi:hypothetical protein
MANAQTDVVDAPAELAVSLDLLLLGQALGLQRRIMPKQASELCHAAAGRS